MTLVARARPIKSKLKLSNKFQNAIAKNYALWSSVATLGAHLKGRSANELALAAPAGSPAVSKSAQPKPFDHVARVLGYMSARGGSRHSQAQEECRQCPSLVGSREPRLGRGEWPLLGRALATRNDRDGSAKLTCGNCDIAAICSEASGCRLLGSYRTIRIFHSEMAPEKRTGR